MTEPPTSAHPVVGILLLATLLSLAACGTAPGQSSSGSGYKGDTPWNISQREERALDG